MKILYFFLLIFLLTVNLSFSKQIPTKENGFDYFYVFSKSGNSGYGANNNISIFFISVLEDSKENLMIKIFDPNVGGRNDEPDGEWNSSTKFSVYGGKQAFSNVAARRVPPEKGYDSGRVLYEKIFTNSKYYDNHWVYIGPYVPQQGEHIGEYYIFKIIVEGLEGNDNNLFKLGVLPKKAEIFSYNISLRLPEEKNQYVNLYPFIPKRVKNLSVSNFDLDASGGNIFLSSLNQRYKIKKSYSGKYRLTEINVKNPNKLKKWKLEILKGAQSKANTSLNIKDFKHRPLRIYFQPK